MEMHRLPTHCMVFSPHVIVTSQSA
jgi:hypothetical protein